MLKRMRRHARSGFIKIVLGMIILAFVFWGISAVVSGSRVDVVATIDGESIAANRYQRELEQLRQFYRNLYRDSYSASLEQALNLPGQALDNLIEGHLLVREAERMGLTVSDEEVARSVMASFQLGGQFSSQRYTAVLRSQNMTPAQFEAAERRRLLIAKLENLIADGIPVDEDEIQASFVAEHEKLKIKFIKLPFSRFKKGITVDEKEIEAYYSANKDEFREPARVRIAYVAYLPEKFEESVSVTPEEIEKAYERQKSYFTEPAQFHLRHILLSAPAEAEQELKAGLREKAEALRKRLTEGEDFAEVARSQSDDKATAEEGGDLDFVTLAELEQPLAQAVKELKVGQISPVVETSKGFELVKLEELKPERTKPLEKVKEEIIKQIRKEGADEVALGARLQDLSKIRAGEDFEKIAEARGLKVERSQPVARGEPIAGVDGADRLIDRAFELGVGQVDQVSSLSPPYYLMQVVDKTPPFVPKLEAVREKIEETLAQEKAKSAAVKHAEQLLSQLSKGKVTIEELGRREGLKVERSGPFVIGDTSVQGLGPGLDLARRLFKLTPESPVSAKPVILTNAVAVVVLEERIAPDLGELDEETRKEIRRKILERKRRLAIDSFHALLKSRSDIRVNADRIAGAGAR